MARLTAAEIVSEGKYLDADFNPASLTVSQLLGVLGYHEILVPTPYTKPRLVEIFRREVTGNAVKFKKERRAKENSVASDEGITDGHTGKPLSKSKGKAAAVPTPSSRRSSRRLSHAPVEEEGDSSPPPPEPPKRRRSSAQPSLGGPRKSTKARAVTPLAEESEPEEEELPVKKVSRTKTTGTAATQSRRISYISGGEDSGWDDNNIFQSGAESSSPVRPSPVRPRQSRLSTAPRKSRKSMSAPPQIPDSPVRNVFPRERAFSPPESPFQPQLPPLPKFRVPSPVRQLSPKREPTPPSLREPTPPRIEEEEQWAEDEDETHAVVKDEEFDEYMDSDLAVAESPPQPVERPKFSLGAFLGRSFVWMLLLTSLYATYEYKVESASIGYCQAGTATSPALEALLKRRQAERDCVAQRAEIKRQHATLNTSEPAEFPECPLPPLLPFPRPSTCTPCPAHAACGQFSVSCETGYLLKPHILLPFPVDPSQTELGNAKVPQVASGIFNTVSALTDGLPGLGSVGLPPRCVEDPMRKQHIGKLGKLIEMMLAKERGRRVCQGGLSDDSTAQSEGTDAVLWGIEIDKLREHFKQQTQNGRYRDKFDELFDEAIQQLVQWGGVFIGENESGQRYVAHKTPDLNWACVVTVKLRQLWAAWRSTVIASILTVLIGLGMRVRMRQRQKESRRVSGLVQVALDALRNQELAHYTDPLTTAQPYLSSIQLRDLVLQDEHSVSTRRRVWEKVEGIVESNANVRANLEEIEGGDETRVWRWVGSAPGGRTPKRTEMVE